MSQHLVRVACFSAQPYDEAFFTAHKDQRLAFTFIKAHLNEQTVELAAGFDAVCVFVNDTLNAKVIDRLRSLGCRHIALRCAGYNNVDIVQAKAVGVSVSRVPAYSPQAVAEHAIALMLTLNRKLHKAYNRVRESNFDLNGLMGFTLHDKTVGLVGTGNIGQATTKILLGFGCNVLCFDPYPNKDLVSWGVEYVSMNELLQQSDIITLHCPLTPDSHHLINAQSIALMKQGVMLINTSRGGLINTVDVINGLKSRHIGFLGLDVYEMESELFFKDHSLEVIQDDVFERLSTFHNVLITGHQGFFTEEALEQITQTTIDNILHCTCDNSIVASIVA